ncbi:MAG: DUF5716 family protein [Hominisplanchenecus sp.]
MFENTPFSAVYLVGREFEGEWMDKSFRFLCRKRRSFRGDNLYTMGACYAAMEENGATACKDTLYLSDDTIQHNLRNVDGDPRSGRLLSAGECRDQLVYGETYL